MGKDNLAYNLTIDLSNSIANVPDILFPETNMHKTMTKPSAETLHRESYEVQCILM